MPMLLINEYVRSMSNIFNSIITSLKFLNFQLRGRCRYSSSPTYVPTYLKLPRRPGEANVPIIYMPTYSLLSRRIYVLEPISQTNAASNC